MTTSFDIDVSFHQADSEADGKQTLEPLVMVTVIDDSDSESEESQVFMLDHQENEGPTESAWGDARVYRPHPGEVVMGKPQPGLGELLDELRAGREDLNARLSSLTEAILQNTKTVAEVLTSQDRRLVRLERKVFPMPAGSFRMATRKAMAARRK